MERSGQARRSPRYRRVEPDPFQITQRDLDLVAAVGRHGVLESLHLDTLVPDGSAQQLRRRLQYLFHAGYLARPRTQIVSMLENGGSRAMVYTLTDRGAQLIAERRGVALSPRADDLKLLQLEHSLEVSDLMVAVEAACRRSAFLALESFDDILARSPEATRGETIPQRWKVAVRHEGLAYTLHLQPDGIFAVCHREAALEGDPRARKHFFLEGDRGTMPVERSSLHQTSVLRKFLTYAQTHRDGIHRSRFAMSNMRVLFVGKNKRRIETMIDAFGRHLTGIASPRLFLFADRQTLFGEGTPFFDCPWLDGEGKSHTLFE